MAIDDLEQTRLVDIRNEDASGDPSKEPTDHTSVSEVQDDDWSQEATMQETIVATEADIISNDDVTRVMTTGDATMIMPSPPEVAEHSRTQTTVRAATVSQRFVAWYIDSLVLWCLYWGCVLGYYQLRFGQWDTLAPTNATPEGMVFHGSFVVLAFLYIFISEAVTTTTLGKWWSGLRVRSRSGGTPSIMQILLRALFLPVDMVLGLIPMELTPFHQRIGDVVGRTIVIQRRSSVAPIAIAWRDIASSPVRWLIGAIDGGLLFALCYGSVLLLSDAFPLRSFWLLVAGLPGILMLWSTLCGFAQATPGSWLFGYQLRQETGDAAGMSHAFLRTLLLPVDILGVGVLAIALSPRHQRLGDFVAGTVLVKQPRRARGSVALISALAFAAAAVAGGQLNPRHLTDSDFSWHFIPRATILPDWTQQLTARTPFTIADVRFAEGSFGNARASASYMPGETMFLVIELSGYTINKHRIWIQEDLAVQNPDQSFGIKLDNFIDQHHIHREHGPYEIRNRIKLPADAEPGKYTVFIKVRDKNAQKNNVLEYTAVFYVKSTDGSVPSEAPTALQPKNDTKPTSGNGPGLEPVKDAL